MDFIYKTIFTGQYVGQGDSFRFDFGRIRFDAPLAKNTKMTFDLPTDGNQFDTASITTVVENVEAHPIPKQGEPTVPVAVLKFPDKITADVLGYINKTYCLDDVSPL